MSVRKFDAADACAVEAGKFCEFFLREISRRPKLSDPLTKFLYQNLIQHY